MTTFTPQEAISLMLCNEVIRYEPEPVDINELIQDVIDEQKPKMTMIQKIGLFW